MLASLAFAATNLNTSRSNIYRLTYPTDPVTHDQAQALLAELDKMGAADEAAAIGFNASKSNTSD